MQEIDTRPHLSERSGDVGAHVWVSGLLQAKDDDRRIGRTRQRGRREGRITQGPSLRVLRVGAAPKASIL
jgi:hypothetical protein